MPTSEPRGSPCHSEAYVHLGQSASRVYVTLRYEGPLFWAKASITVPTAVSKCTTRNNVDLIGGVKRSAQELIPPSASDHATRRTGRHERRPVLDQNLDGQSKHDLHLAPHDLHDLVDDGNIAASDSGLQHRYSILPSQYHCLRRAP